MRTKWLFVSILVIGIFIAGCSTTSGKTLPPPEVSISASTSLPPSFQSTAAPSLTRTPSSAASGQPQNTAPAQVVSSAPSSTVPVQPTVPAPTPTSSAPAATPTLPATPTTVTTPTAQPEGQSSSASASGQASAPAQACQDQAAFYGDVTVPDNTSFRQGVNFVKTWQIRNTGTCPWGAGYSLVFAGGDIMNGPQSVPLPTVNPGDIFNISVNLTSPANGGTYLGDWEFQRPDGTRFGVNSNGVDMIWVKIVVSYIVVGPTATPNPISASCNGQTNTDYINQVLTLINNARVSNNLSPLTLNDKLSAAAQAHSNDMACNDFVDHVGSDGSTWYTRVKAQGYTYSYASENIYVGNPTFGGDAQGAFTWWMNSQVHRDNILSPKVTQIGIGYTFYDKSTYGGYFTVDFGHP